MRYDFNSIEKKWQKIWAERQTFKAENNSDKPKYYVLDMFPYPSGAGLHVGHPLGYIASDIYSRYKRHKGFNVLHPMGYDSFGLPAEQYAIQTGQHPAVTTAENIKTYRRQLDQIGFSFDWSREVRTSDPNYYKWTQWIFSQLFQSWYNKDTDKAEAITTLEEKFKTEGNGSVNAACDDDVEIFTSQEWNAYSDKEKQGILLKYRLTYLAETEVNWCPALGTVLANDEIVNGVSERGGHSVIRKKMTQWSMRISAYAERLLQGLETIDWTDSLKESQRNWIGKSVGAQVEFRIQNSEFRISVFTTRPDTIFGVSFMTLAPEHHLVPIITTEAQKAEVEAYVEATSKRSERDRMADVKTITGAFTGAYAEHPFTKEPIPIWIGDYVLASYGTGAVMSVPCGDQRDYDFAKHFNIPIPNIFEGVDITEEAFSSKENVKIANSDFLNGMNFRKATKRVIYELEQLGQGEGKTNYRLRDAVFSRQRYWGEPFPVYYVNGMPQLIDEEHLPLTLPEVEKYLPTEEGEPPLGRADIWAWDVKHNKVVSNEMLKQVQHNKTDDNVTLSAVEGSQKNGVYPLELNTMPGWAGSSWYFFRYMEEKANRDKAFASKEALKYWESVDLYIGGSEHATGHLLYSRFWVKFLYDRGFVGIDEPFKKLINQGMILGTSAFVYRLNVGFLWEGDQFASRKEFFDNDIYITKDIFDLLDFGDYGQFARRNKDADCVFEFLESYINDFILKGSEEIKDIFHGDKTSENLSFQVLPRRVKVSYVNASDELDIEGLKNDKEFGKDYKDAIFISEKGKLISGVNDIYKVGREVEKMSKSKLNVVNPDEICEQYGADSLRLYEMFLGPLEQYKPWNTAGITGVHGFLKKLWKLFHSGDNNTFYVDPSPLGKSEGAGALKTLHKTIKKVEEDIENFSFNTSVSTFMIAVNELTAQKCNSREILEALLILISPYAPHIAEELWEKLGHSTSISTAAFPKFDETYLIESTKNYPISFNGKMRFTLELPLDMSREEIEKAVLAYEKTKEQIQGRTPKKVIVVPGKIVNIVG